MRWKLEGADGQGTLFDSVERVPGRGEFRGMEFLHVRAGKLINSLPASTRLPFRHTVNVYRGCSHSCTYCQVGDALVLMGDGRTRRMADVQVGDEIYGTQRRGAYRRYVRTIVLDHWSVGTKPAFRTTLSDGTSLITSGEHRFLSNRGWKHVTGEMCGHGQRPYLTPNNELLGTGAFAEQPKHDDDYRRGYLCGMVRGDAWLASKGFRLALVDDEALERSKRYLASFGIETKDRLFQAATTTRRVMHSISCGRAGAELVYRLIAWPRHPSESWDKGFLAGIFDAEGGCSRGVLRITNKDEEILLRTLESMDAFGFDCELEPPSSNGCRNVRLLGGLVERLRFFHTVDPAITRKRDIDGTAIKTKNHLRVVTVEPLGFDLPMYDITTGTGDYVSDGVISHNCFARPTHDYLGLDIGEGFDRQIVVKTNAVERLRAELAPQRWAGEPIAMGTNTDPYQRCEGKYHLTQGVIEVLSEARNPFSILTKSTLVLRDADLLAEASERTQVSLTFSVGTLDEQVWRVTEPGTPPPWKRLEAIARLREKGVEAGVLLAPILPGLSDGAEQISEVVKAATEAGATTVGGGMVVYLKAGVREHFVAGLRRHDDELADRYEQTYKDRPHPARDVQQAVRRRLDAALAEHRPPARGLHIRRWKPVDQPKPAPAPPPPQADQLSLGV